MKTLRFVGLVVHAESIAVAVAESRGEVRFLGVIPNRPEPVRRLFKKLGEPGRLRACYEAGPTGYVLYWQLAQLGVKCEVVAPTLVPVKAGDQVKTDRRDAPKLARCYRAAELTRCGHAMRGMTCCAIWFVRAKRRRKINCGRGTVYRSFCCGMGTTRRRKSKRGASDI